MSVRATMADLITAVRGLVNDPEQDDSSLQVFDSQRYQDALDRTRTDYNYLELWGKQTVKPGGGVVWLDYYAEAGSLGLGDWEADVVLQGYPNFAILAPITSDFLVGHWTFDTSIYPQGQRPPVYLIGKRFDRYLAASDLLQQWAATLKLKYSFASDSQTMQLREQIANVLALAKEYKSRARPRTAQLVRTDTPRSLWQRRSYDQSRTSF